MKAVKIIAAIAGVIVVVLVAGVAIIAATFDPDKYKPEIAALVKEKTGRTLTIDGPLKLSVFPKLGVSMGRVRLSEPNGTKAFASLSESRVSLALLPLLSKQVVVDRVVLAGLNAELVRGKDGRLNIDDLTGAGAAKPAAKDGGIDKGGGAASVKLEVDGVDIRADSLGWRDEMDGTQVKVTALQLKTGRIAEGAQGKLELSARVEGVRPKMGLALSLAAGYRMDPGKGAVALSGLSAKVEGDAPGAAGLLATLKGDIESDPGKGLLRVAGLELSARTRDGIEAGLNLPKLSISKQGADSSDAKGTIKIIRPGLSVDAKVALAASRSEAKAGGRAISFAKVDLDFTTRQGELAVQGKLAPPVAVNLDAKSAQLAKLAGELRASGPAIPNKSLRVALYGQFGTEWEKQTASGNMTAKLDESTLQAKFGVKGFSPAAINFDVALDRLNVDRYLPPKSAGTAKPAADAPIDLAALKGLNLNGQARVGQLAVSGIKLEKLQLGVRAAGGRLDLNPVSAALYGGNLAGTAAVTSAATPAANQFAVKQQLTGVSIGPLLRDVADKDMLEGRGNVAIDVQASGATVGALKRALAGSANFSLKDGAIKGINLAESFRK
ncbi:MAG: AsmA family protein, partial [Betaproteobacteria bacterium]|nr:AsmA family protein [Betaproteobacteria bacterium]